MKLKHLPLILIFLVVNLASAQIPTPVPAQSIRSVQWSPDGHYIAIGYESAHVEVVDALSSEVLFTFDAPSGSAKDVVWSHDGGKLAAAIGTRLYVWETSTYAQLHYWDAFETPITSLVWSPDGTELASTNRVSGEVVELKFWNLVSDDLRFSSSTLSNEELAWDTTQNRLTGSNLLTTVVIDPLTGHLQSLCSHCSSDGPYEIAWSPNGARIALATHYYIALPDLQGTEAFGIDTDGHAIYSVSWSPSSIYLASGDDAGKVQIWNPDTFTVIQEIVTGQDAIYAVDWSPDGTRLAYGGTDGRLEIWAVELDLPTPTPIVLDVAWNADGNMIATVDDSGALNVTVSDQTTPVFEFAGASPTLFDAAVAWSPEGGLLAAGIGNQVYVWETISWQLDHQFVGGDSDGSVLLAGMFEEIPEGIASITWSSDSRYLVSGSLSYLTTVWDNQESQVIYQSPDGSGGGPGRVWLEDGWMGDGATRMNAFTGEVVVIDRSELQYRFGAGGGANATAVRPNYMHIAWGTEFGFLLIYDLYTLRGVQALEVTQSEPPVPRRALTDIAWNGDGNFVGAVSRDGEVYLVNLVTEEVTSVLNVGGKLNAVDWNPQSNEIIYAGVSDSGQPIMSIVNVGGIGGVPSATPTPE